MVGMTLWSCGAPTVSFILIVYFGYKIHTKLRKNQYLSQQTIAMHSMLVRVRISAQLILKEYKGECIECLSDCSMFQAITIQACLPFINMIILVVDLVTIVFNIDIPYKNEIQYFIIGGFSTNHSWIWYQKKINKKLW